MLHEKENTGNMSICILLSTYNGGNYLEEQLKSIEQQETNEEISLFIRDDGSSDHTIEILEKYIHSSSLNISYFQGEHLGPSGSFLELIFNAPAMDYYAFCDQDDVWKPGKLSAAVNSLKDQVEPALWICNFDATDENLNTIEAELLITGTPELHKVLFDNFWPGCAMVFNKLLLNEIRKVGIHFFNMHDVLALSVALLSGKVIIEKGTYVLYRQHAHNAMGLYKKIGLTGKIRKAFMIAFSGTLYNYSTFARRIMEIYHERLSDYEKNELRLIRDYRKGFNKLRLLKQPYVRNREGHISKSIMLMILLGKL